MPPPLERQIENKCCRYAEAFGWLHVKLDNAKRGWPDRLFLGAGCRLLFVEFKRPGLKPSKKQAALHQMMHDRGFDVHIIDNFDDFKILIRSASWGR